MRSYLKTLVVALSLGFTMVACANVDPYSENIPNQNGEGGSSDNGIEYISVLEDGDPVYLVVYGDEPHLRIDKSLLSGWTGDIVLRGEGVSDLGLIVDLGSDEVGYDQVALPSYITLFCLRAERQFPNEDDGYESHWSFGEYYNSSVIHDNGFGAYVGGPSDEPVIDFAIQWSDEDGKFIGAEGVCEDLDDHN